MPRSNSYSFEYTRSLTMSIVLVISLFFFLTIGDNLLMLMTFLSVINDVMMSVTDVLCSTGLSYGVDPFFSNLAVEEVPNHEFLLGHSHFAYVLPLSNHTSSTDKLGKKGSTP